jgi:iron complex transport system substrate-binding protein
LAQLRKRYAGTAPVRVFYQVWPSPLMTLNREHLVSDVIELCGGRNVFGELQQLVPMLSTESVVVANPEVMLASREAPGNGGGSKREPTSPSFAAWTRYSGLTAVRRKWLYTLPGDTISRQGPRIAQGAQAMCEALEQVRAERAGTQ